MATPTKFYQLVTDIAGGYHDGCLNASTDALYVALIEAASQPTTATDAVWANISGDEITGSGYTSGGSDVQNTDDTTNGVITVDGTNIVWTATASDWDAMRYPVLYNFTQTSPLKPLMLWYDYGSSVTLLNTETFTFNITSTLFTIS